MANPTSSPLQKESNKELKPLKEKELPKKTSSFKNRVFTWIKKSAQTTYIFRLTQALKTYKRKDFKSVDIKSKYSIFPLQDAKKIAQIKIAYLSLQSLSMLLQTVTSVISTIASVIRFLLPQTTEAANFIAQEVMNPILAFIAIKDLIIHMPRFGMHTAHLVQIYRLRKELETGNHKAETITALSDLLIKVEKRSPTVFENLPNGKEELENLIKKDPIFVLRALEKNIKIKLAEVTLILLFSMAALLQTVFTAISPPAAIAMNVLYWVFVLMSYAVRPIAQKCLS